MTTYATTTDYAAYRHVGESELSTETERQIERAASLIDSAIHPNTIDVSDSEEYAAAVEASCAQVEYWQEGPMGEDVEYQGAVSQTGMKSVQTAYSSPTPRLAPRAKDALLRAGLLYRGVSVT